MQLKASRVLLLGFFAGVLAALAVWDALLDKEFAGVFEPGGGTVLERLDQASSTTILKEKLRHGVAHPRTGLGIFGNSRSVQVRVAELHASQAGSAQKEKGFNFSVPGTSFRNSVAFLDVLAAQGRAPKVALVSVDNFYLEYDNTPVLSGLGARLRALLRDLPHLDGGFPAKARLGWRFVWGEWIMFQQYLNISRLTDAAQTLPKGDGNGWRSDGSRPLMNTPPARDGAAPPREPQALRLEFLALGLAHLARVQHESGIRIIVYESPLHPAYRLGDRNPDQREKKLREGFAEYCAAYGVECVLAPDGIAVDWPEGWSDLAHASTPAIERSLRALLESRMKTDDL